MPEPSEATAGGESEQLCGQAQRDAEQAVDCMRQGDWSRGEALLQLAAERIDDAGVSARPSPAETRARPTGFGFLSLRKFARLVANLLRDEAADERVVVGTYGPSPVEGGAPLFHDLCLNLTVADFRQWAPDHVEGSLKQGSKARRPGAPA